jgi:hypothetical protein
MQVRSLIGLIAAGLLSGTAGAASELAREGHYLFAWAGDADGRGEDFIAVIDADPVSPRYGELLTSAASMLASRSGSGDSVDY